MDHRGIIHLVSWNNIFKSKNKGGLGVKNIKVFNMTLVSKGKWRILKEKETLRARLLSLTYRNMNMKVFNSDTHSGYNIDSIWWRDL